jgi:hypothetical protein
MGTACFVLIFCSLCIRESPWGTVIQIRSISNGASLLFRPSHVAVDHTKTHATCCLQPHSVGLLRIWLFLILTISYRRSLYPHLEDHAKVKSYPSVRGMANDIWFFHHTNKENSGGDDGVSKCNMFEVSKISAFVCSLLNLIRWKWSNPLSFSFYGKPDSQ